MSPVSGTVLVAAAVVASPAAWRWLVLGTMPMEVAVTRYLVALVLCWVGLSAVARLLTAVAPTRRAPSPDHDG